MHSDYTTRNDAEVVCCACTWRAALLFVAVMLFPTTLLRAERSSSILYVDAAANGANNGGSWAGAFVDLQSALQIALPGTEVRIAQGVYRPDSGTNDRTRTFQLISGVILRGGYAGVTQPNPDSRNIEMFHTILSGDIGTPNLSSDNSYHVVSGINIDGQAMVEGVTIRGGNANSDWPNDRGGGMSLNNSSPTLEQCTFTSNHSSSNGGGLDLANLSSPNVDSCRFLSNSTNGTGAGIYSNGGSPTIQQCMFIGNVSDGNGGGLTHYNAPATISGCTFENNSAVFSGGGAYIQSSNAVINNCLFRNNLVLNSITILFDGAGGLFLRNGSPAVRYCQFFDNLSSDDGGAILTVNAAVEIRNCWFGNNLASDNGGAVYTSGGSLNLVNSALLGNRSFKNGAGLYTTNTSVNIANCTVARNRSNLQCGGLYLNQNVSSIANSIIWVNEDANGTLESSQITVFATSPNPIFCCVQDWTGALGGWGNILVPPRMTNVDGQDGIAGTTDDNIRLRWDSPCINAGDPLAVPNITDVDFYGNSRMMGCRIDIGAHEYVTGLPSSGDMNGDTLVDGLDIPGFLAAMLGTGPPAYRCVADIDSDNFVTEADLSLFTEILHEP